MNKLIKLRNEIDKINSQILNLIIKRINIVKKVFYYKKQKNIPAYDIKREKEMLKRVKKLAKQKNLDENFIEKLFKLIIKQGKKEEKK